MSAADGDAEQNSHEQRGQRRLAGQRGKDAQGLVRPSGLLKRLGQTVHRIKQRRGYFRAGPAGVRDHVHGSHRQVGLRRLIVHA